VDRAAPATDCFFPRRRSLMTIAVESPNIPLIACKGLNPGNLYASVSLLFAMSELVPLFWEVIKPFFDRVYKGLRQPPPLK
jgi:hypothetical protein